MKKRVFLFALTLILAFSLLPINALATEYSDTKGHWGEKAVLRWSDYGILTGYPDGTFHPDAPISRGELAAILNRVMNFPKTSQSFFSDINGEWYEKDVNALAAQGVYITGTGKAEGGKIITREEAVEMFYRAIPRNYAETISNTFTDIYDVAPEYRAAVVSYKNCSHISGMGDGTFQPKGAFTRAQVVTILNNMFTAFYNEPGTYEIVTESNHQTICISAPNVTVNIHSKSGETRNPKLLVVTPGAAGGKTVISAVNWFTSRTSTDGVFYGEHLLTDRNALTTTDGKSFADLDLPPSKGADPAWVYNSFCHVVPIRGEPDKGFAGGIGTKGNPYLIASEAQLKLLEGYLGQMGYYNYFKLSNDINLTGAWEPIGDCSDKTEKTFSSNDVVIHETSEYYKNTGFYGHLDGGGYAIRNLNVSYSGDKSKALGLFEGVFGSVRNLNVFGKISGEITGNTFESADTRDSRVLRAGMIAGTMSKATIENCTVNADISLTAKGTTIAGGVVGYSPNAKILKCKAEGSIRVTSDTSAAKEAMGTMSHAGGISGIMFFGTLSDCVSTASVSASGGYVAHAGGIGGVIEGDITVERCFAGGSVHAENGQMQTDAGGIAGFLGRDGFKGYYCKVTQCVSVADISGSGTARYFNAAGGIAGNAQNNLQIRDCFAAGRIDVSGDSVVGGLIGRNNNVELYSSYATTKITALGSWSDYTKNGIIGAYQSNLYVYGCGDFSTATPCFSSFPSASGTTELISLAGKSLSSAATYQTYGGSSLSSPATKWDFDNVWTFSSANSGYKYAVLRWMPESLIKLIK